MRVKSFFKLKLSVNVYNVYFNADSKLLILQIDNMDGSIVMTKGADSYKLENNFPLNMLMS